MHMARLINVGFGNGVNTSRIVAVVSPEAAPVKRMVQKDHIVLSALQPETIARRVSNDSEYLTKEEEDMDE